jgi:hypothetical protein
MPCVECETRDKERAHGGIVGKIHYRKDGETYYTCLNCMIEKLKDAQ